MEHEIDFIKIFKKIFKFRIRILCITIIFLMYSYFKYCYKVPKKYKSSVTILYHNGGSGGSNNLNKLTSLAGLPSLSFNAGSESRISVNLYKDIIKGEIFKSQFLKVPFHFEQDKAPIVYEDYYSPKNHSKKQKTDSLKKIESLQDVFISTKEQYSLMNQIDNQILLEVDNEKGLFTISSEMNSPLLATEFVKEALRLLKKSLADITKTKIKSTIAHLEKDYKKHKALFKKQQKKLTDYQSSNRELNTPLARTRLKLLKDEYQLAYQIYTLTYKELLLKKMSTSNTMPAFQIFKPIDYNNSEITTSYSFVLTLWGGIGFIIGCLSAFWTDAVRIIKQLFADTDND